MSHFVCGDTFYSVIALPFSTLVIFIFYDSNFVLVPLLPVPFFLSIQLLFIVCLLLRCVCVCAWSKREIIRPTITECLSQHKIDDNYCKHFAGTVVKMAGIINSPGIAKKICASSLFSIDNAFLRFHIFCNILFRIF